MARPAADFLACTVRFPDGEPEAVTFEVVAEGPVLHQMVRCALRALPVGCRGGGCGVCRVRVVDGTYRTLRMSRRHVTEADEANRIALACRLLASSDIVIEPAPPVGPTAPPPSADGIPQATTGPVAPGRPRPTPPVRLPDRP